MKAITVIPFIDERENSKDTRIFGEIVDLDAKSYDRLLKKGIIKPLKKEKESKKDIKKELCTMDNIDMTEALKKEDN